ncbi:MAG: hypothetical protein ABSD74_12375 [Rhizomicrobium sp.]
MANASTPDLSSVALLVSHDRSGSHYLGSYIRTLPNCRMIDEVCNEQAIDPVSNPLSFFGFRHKHAIGNPDYALRRRPDVIAALLDAYFGFVLEQSEAKRVAIDIKYGHVHNFEIAWWPIFRKPFLFDYARSRRIRIIHLSRWNSLETVVSGEVAERRKQWHADGDKPQATEADAVVIDCKRAHEQILLLNQQKEAFDKWLHGARAHAVLYEDLVNPWSGEDCRARIASFMGEKAAKEFSSPYRKVTPALPKIVRNWAEVALFCRENGLAHYLLPAQDHA